MEPYQQIDMLNPLTVAGCYITFRHIKILNVFKDKQHNCTIHYKNYKTSSIKDPEHVKKDQMLWTKCSATTALKAT